MSDDSGAYMIKESLFGLALLFFFFFFFSRLVNQQLCLLVDFFLSLSLPSRYEGLRSHRLQQLCTYRVGAIVKALAPVSQPIPVLVSL